MTFHTSPRAPRFQVKVDKRTLYDYDGYISELVVDTTIDGANYFTMTLAHPFDHQSASFRDLDWQQFEPGTEVTVSMGYDTDLEKVFVGEIETLESEFPPYDPPRVIVSGFDPLRNMMKESAIDSWTDTTLADVVDDVCDDYLCDIHIEDAENIKINRLYKNEQSQYRFLRELADRYGFEFFSSLGEGYFRPQLGGQTPPEPVAELTYGESLELFSAELSPPEVGAVEVRYWHRNKKDQIVGRAENDSDGETSIHRVPVESEAEAERVAEAILDREMIRGSGETFGVPTVLAGTVIDLDGVGSKFSNSYYVTDVSHQINDKGYRMAFDVVALDAVDSR